MDTFAIVTQNLSRDFGFLHKMNRIMILFVIAGLIALTCFTDVPTVEGSEQALSQGPYSPQGKIETGDLETFTDELITRQLAEYHIAGAIVAIVKNGKVEVSKGYGYANVAEQVPVTPDETIFRIGSTSKLFTWTAVMQLAEQGKIDLNADVNTYLPDFQIPDTYPEPITMLNLLSHTAGFEERATGIESRSPEEMISLHDCLATYLPDRVRPSGELATYSNHGTALAGYIVESVSGMPFEKYVETYIFKPLSMTHSTFRQPLPPDLEGQLATSYSYQGEFVPGSFEYVNLRPAGAMSSTANDMANFMLAHLQDGKFENSQILEPDTTRQMHSHLFSNDERLDGLAYGFIEETRNGRRVLWHGGDIGNWHSLLAIIPDENLGFFVDYNSSESMPAVAEFYLSFFDAFFPAQESGDLPLTESTNQVVKDLAGEYRSTRSVYNHVERIGYFPGSGNFPVVINPEGTLSIAGQTYYETGPLVYRSPDGADTLVFHRDGGGTTTHLQFNSIPIFAYERVSWYETAPFNFWAFAACYGLLLTALLAGLIGIFRRRKGGVVESDLPRIARIWVFILSLIFLLVPVVATIYTALDYKSPFPFYMVVALAIILATSILVIGPVIFTILAWARGFWGRAGRIHYTLVTLALLGMVWLMYYWRLLGFRY